MRKNSTQHSSPELCDFLLFLHVIVVLPGIAIAERLAPFKVKKFIYTDVEPRPELASAINAEYGKKCGVMSKEDQCRHSVFC